MKARPSLSSTHIVCAGSIALVNAGNPRIASGDAANDGKWLHTALASYLRTGASPTAFPNNELAFLYWRGVNLFDKGADDCPPLRPYFTGPLCVEALVAKGTPTEGTCDFYSYDESTGRLCCGDWKSGRLEKDAIYQLRTYAANVMLALGIKPTSVWLVQVWLRDGFYRWSFEEPEAVLAHHAAIMENVKKAEEAKAGDLSMFSTGPNCQVCPASLFCPALAATLRPLMALTGAGDGAGSIDLGHYSDAALTLFRSKLGLLEKFVAAGKDALKARAEVAPITTGEGREYGPVSVEVKEWNPPLAITLINKTLSRPGAARECVKILQEPLKEAIMAEAPRGEKKKAWDSFCETAVACGALAKRESVRFTEHETPMKELE